MYIAENDPWYIPLRVTLNVVTTQSEKEMPKHMLRKNNPGWIQQKKKKSIENKHGDNGQKCKTLEHGVQSKTMTVWSQSGVPKGFE